MAGKYLGDTFDIHGGGSTCASRTTRTSSPSRARQPVVGFANYWMHNAWVTMASARR
jgi:cysteinyl-tRNA synthetase